MKQTVMSAGHRGLVLSHEERECFCGAAANGRGLSAPKGYYRCPYCREYTPEHLLVRRTVHEGQSGLFPTVRVVGSASSTLNTPATLSAGTITAAPGDILFAQVLGRRDTGVDQTVSVSWGSAAISFPFGSTYQMVGGISYGRCMRHEVIAHQTAEMLFNFSGTVPNRRVINVIRVSGLRPQGAVVPFDFTEENDGYPTSVLLPTSVGPFTFNFDVVCHGQHNTSEGLPAVVWDNRLVYQARTDIDGLTGNILTTAFPIIPPLIVRATSGPALGNPHGTGVFDYSIQP